MSISIKRTDKNAATGSISSTTALTIPNELPIKYPNNNMINDSEYLRHGLTAHELSESRLSTTFN